MPAAVMVPFARQHPVEEIAGAWCASFMSLEFIVLMFSATLAEDEWTGGNWNQE